MADEKVDWDAFYRDVGISKKEGQGSLTTRKVNTVAVDPFTGKPLGSSGAPPNEVVVPGGTNTGLGYQSGQSFPDSYRLLPTGPLGIAGETPATRAIQTASPDMRGMVVNPLSRDSVAQRTAGLGFRPPVMDNGAFGVPMSKTMQAILANDPSYAAQRGVIPQAGAPASSRIVQAMIDRETQKLASSIRGGADPGVNTIIRTINQSGDPTSSRTELGVAIGDRNRKSGNPTYTVSGSNNSFQPKSVQNSVRWQTGY